tara:strand:- start:996 stop:1268 length:273 start_codon:yes stop_codon:yes gene_type:complete
MDLPQIDMNLRVSNKSDVSAECEHNSFVSLEAEIPEVLYQGMKEFLGSNPRWDQYTFMSSALAYFLFQNGCEDRAVTERYLNDLFIRQED